MIPFRATEHNHNRNKRVLLVVVTGASATLFSIQQGLTRNSRFSIGLRFVVQIVVERAYLAAYNLGYRTHPYALLAIAIVINFLRAPAEPERAAARR